MVDGSSIETKLWLSSKSETLAATKPFEARKVEIRIGEGLILGVKRMRGSETYYIK